MPKFYYLVKFNVDLVIAMLATVRVIDLKQASELTEKLVMGVRKRSRFVDDDRDSCSQWEWP